MINKGIVLLALSLLIIPVAKALNIDFSFRHLTIDNGLSNSNVNSIVQDREGFIWIATENGLNKYDGYKFSCYYANANDSLSLTSAEVFSLLIDSNNRLWVGTFSGLFYYNPVADNFIHITFYDAHGVVNQQPILDLIEDKNKNLWIATSGNGIIKYNLNTETYENYIPVGKNGKLISDKYILSLYMDNKGRIIAGCDENGFYIIDSQSGIAENYTLGDIFPDVPGSNSVQSAFQLNTDSLLIGTRGGLYCFNYRTKKISEFNYDGSPLIKQQVVIHDIITDRQNHLWILTNGEGVICIDKYEHKLYRIKHSNSEPKSLMNNNSRTIFEDRQGNIWIASFQGGINLLPNKIRIFRNYNLSNPSAPYSSNTVTSIVADNHNNVWVGTDGGGLKYIDRQANKTIHYYPGTGSGQFLPDKAVVCLMMDGDQNLWIGTYLGGASKYNTRNGKFNFFKNKPDQNSLSNNFVSSILNCRNGQIWIGTNGGGLNKYLANEDRFIRFNMVDSVGKTALINDWVNCMIEDHAGNIWIGTFWGLSIYNPKTDVFTNYLKGNKNAENISSNVIYSIIETSKNEIWIGTRDGLNKFIAERNAFAVYTKANGLSGNIIYGIQEDSKGTLWLSTDRGISNFDPLSGKTHNYYASDGLQSNEFFRSATFKNSDGELFFGGINGLNSFFPDSITEQYSIPVPVIIDFRIFDQPILAGHPFDNRILLNQPIYLTKTLRLKYKDNSFSFEMAALDFVLPEKNFYRYTMEGFDADWKTVDYTQRNVTYTNLDAGTYHFKFRSSSIDNEWNDNYQQLTIVIDPPWYKTWWAYILYYVAIVGILFSIWLFTINRIRLSAKIKLERLNREKSEELNQAKLRFFTNISHEFRTPITLIVGPMEKMLNDKKIHKEYGKSINLMLKNANRLLRLVNQLMDLRKIEGGGMKLRVSKSDIISFVADIYESFSGLAQQKNIDFQYVKEIDELLCWFDSDKIDKMLFNLLSNAFKYTPEHGEISIHVAQINVQDEPWLQIQVKDTGRGIPLKDQAQIFERFYQSSNNDFSYQIGSGVGLSLTRYLIEIHKGNISFTSTEGTGTSFTLSFPLSEDKYDAHERIDHDWVPAITYEHQHPDMSANDNDEPIIEEITPGDLPIVLIVEDNHDLRKYIAGELSGNYQVREARDGKEGLEIALHDMPDLIISDIMMPEMDGLELCKAIKTNLVTNHIPVILLTARTSIEQRIEGIELGADSYIPKPFHPDHLKVRVKKLIEMRVILKEKFSAQMADMEIEINPIEDKFLKKLTQVIKDNISEPELSIEWLSGKMNMSRGHLHRKLKLLTDKSPSEYVRIIKLNQSLTLLKNREYNISEVCYMVGFNSPSYFTNCFKNHFKMSPTEYVERNG